MKMLNCGWVVLMVTIFGIAYFGIELLPSDTCPTNLNYSFTLVNLHRRLIHLLFLGSRDRHLSQHLPGNTINDYSGQGRVWPTQ